MMSASDVRTMLEVIGFLATPLFAAGGAWVSVKTAMREIALLRSGQRRLESRVANLYGRLRIPMPIDVEERN